MKNQIQQILDRNFTRGDNAKALKELCVLFNVSGCYVENNKLRPIEKSSYGVIYSDKTFGEEYWDGHSWKAEKPVVYWKAK